MYYQELNDLIFSEPHFLIAGASGSGKSVLLNTLICSLCSAYSSDDLQLVLIDPKRVELSCYRNMTHVSRLATEPQDILNTLLSVSAEMESRYKEMQRKGLRFSTDPVILVVVDEIADLMLSSARKQIETVLQHIAQLGRAANIRLILATQIVRADILTLKITSNINGRIALHCANKLESRQILGFDGAELLPKYGQGIFKTSSAVCTYNIPFTPEERIQEVVTRYSKKSFFKRRKLI